MTSIILTATITKDRHLEIDLPEDVPLGPVEVVITPLPTQSTDQLELTRDEIRARLKAAGLLSEGKWSPEDAKPLSDTEREKLSRLYAGPQSIGDLVDEDRGPR